MYPTMSSDVYYVILTTPGWDNEALQDAVHSGVLERYLATSFKKRSFEKRVYFLSQCHFLPSRWLNYPDCLQADTWSRLLGWGHFPLLNKQANTEGLGCWGRGSAAGVQGNTVTTRYSNSLPPPGRLRPSPQGTPGLYLLTTHGS